MNLFGRTIRPFSIGQFLVVLSAVVMTIAVALVLMLSQFIERRAVNDLAQQEARQTSELIFQALYSAMRKGWTQDEIQDIIRRLNETQPDATIRVYRAPAVVAQYGDIPGEAEKREADPLLRQVLTDSQERLIHDQTTIRYLYPVIVKEECLACHDAPLGALNGIVDVTFPVTNLKVSLAFVVRSVIIYFTVILAILFTVLYFKLRFFIAFPIARFVHLIEDIIRHTDLSRRIDGPVSNLKEVQQLSDHFNRLLSTIHDYQERLRQYSERDPLTGLYNRRKFEEFLRIEVDRGIRHQRPFSLVMIDIDNFKHINDTYGHPVGDLALKEVAAMLSHRLRRTDVIARLGGDEFAILLPDTDLTKALAVAEGLCQTLGETTIHLPVGSARAHASLGVVAYPDNGGDAEKLVIAMDVALYKAKRMGKNRLATLDASEEGTVMEVFTRGQQLRQALDDRRLVPVFQPIVDIASGKTFGYEVLARIRDGDALVPASHFIETAEELGLARAIDEAVFRTALEEAAILKDGDATLFFNLSARTVSDTHWMRGIPDLALMHGISPKRVVLEITEREALPHFDTLVGLMNELRGRGIAFALDDFGSGFSSFLYLKYLSVDYVKIEGSFVRHIATDPRDRVMVEHIHGMARQFGLRTIAEFVEDEDTSAMLREMGITLGQGYHYGRPMVSPRGERPET